MTEKAASKPANPATSPVSHNRPVNGASKPIMVLRSAEFRKLRESGWRRLDYIVSRVEKKGIAALEPEEVRLLPLLYRSVMSSLSMARGIALDRNMLLYLEDLALRSYLVVYGPRVGVVQTVREFIFYGFPQAVREMRWHIFIIAAVLLASAIAGYMIVMSDMTYYSIFVPTSLADGRIPGATVEYLKYELFMPWPGFIESFIVFANFLFQHNSLICIAVFGLGFMFGVPTVMLVISNGLVLGSFVALHADAGLAYDCIGWLSIHGVTELLAVTLSAAAGLRVADLILFPGALPRLDNLVLHGSKAAGVAIGAVGMLFIAGIIEGGFRQLINFTLGRYVFAVITAVLWWRYFTKVGKDRENVDFPDRAD